MPRRIVPIVTDQIYHIVTKSRYCPTPFITGSDYSRMIEAFKFYKFAKRPGKLSSYLQNGRIGIKASSHLVEIIAFCIMPNHIHLLLKQKTDSGISNFMSMVLNSYTKYFNLKYNRHGPMWEKGFKDIIVNSSEQLLHLTRYIHLNPVTAFLTNDPYAWKFSSYREYVNNEEEICTFSDIIDLCPDRYKTFCISNIELQRQRAQSKVIIS